MNRLHFRDLHRQVESLEETLLPEPKVTVYWQWVGENGLPNMICGPDFFWTRSSDDEPVPELPPL